MILKGVLLVGILGTFLQLAPSTHASDPALTMTVTCDNNMQVFIDGNPVASNNVWEESSIVDIPSLPALIGIYCHDLHVVAGILAHFSDGQVTDARWKCRNVYEANWNQPSFNDSHWPNAHEIIQYPGGVWANQVVGMTGSPYWIWTTGWEGEDIDVYCRRSIQDCTQTVNGACSKPKCGVGIRSVMSVCGAEHYYNEEYCCEGPCPASGTHPTPPPNATPRPSPATQPPPPVSMTVTCDNKLEVYVNGVLDVVSEDWQQSSTVHLGVPPAVVAIHCVDHGVIAGILAHFSNGEVTDDTWKCSNTFEDRWNQISFDDDSWTDATQIIQYPNGVWGSNVVGMTGSPFWIWTEGYNGQDKDVYCRRTIGDAARQYCRNYPPFQNV